MAAAHGVLRSSKKLVECFYDVTSPNSWFGFEDEDITQPESILAAAGKAGIPLDRAQKLLEMSTSPEVKDHLKAVTDEAMKYGAFGVPSFVAHVGGQPQLFFGADRIELLGDFLHCAAITIDGFFVQWRPSRFGDSFEKNGGDPSLQLLISK